MNRKLKVQGANKQTIIDHQPNQQLTFFSELYCGPEKELLPHQTQEEGGCGGSRKKRLYSSLTFHVRRIVLKLVIFFRIPGKLSQLNVVAT